MIKYNSKNIIVGQIKQILSSFNLPNIHVYDKKLFDFLDLEKKEISKEKVKEELSKKLDGTYWIKDNYIKMYLHQDPNPDFWKNIHDVLTCAKTTARKEKGFKAGLDNIIRPYVYNQEINNYTKNFINNNNIYDTNTHKYLGDYLRFQRDYNNLNLMSLYNCFSNELVKDLSFTVKGEPLGGLQVDSLFDSKDPQYKIYMIPVKYFQKYTIAIDSDLPVEFVCGFYDKTQSKNPITSNTYIINSYLKVSHLSYNKPLLYNKIYGFSVNGQGKEVIDPGITFFPELNLDIENSLKLFIKIAKSNNSSITILEGDYTTCNDRSLQSSYNLNKNNRTIVNYKKATEEDREDFSDLNLISHNQLLSINSSESHPFADRLIEYLLRNTIDNKEKTSDNIKRLQTVLRARYLVTDKTESGELFHPQLGLKTYKNYGIWEDKYRAIIYDIASTNTLLKENESGVEIFRTQNNVLINNKNDILGYIDKDLEKEIVAVNKEVDSEGKVKITKTTTIDVDIYGEGE